MLVNVKAKFKAQVCSEPTARDGLCGAHLLEDLLCFQLLPPSDLVRGNRCPKAYKLQSLPFPSSGQGLKQRPSPLRA